MIIWRGCGILVLIGAFLCMVATESLVEQHYKDDAYCQEHAWPMILACAVAGILAWVLGRFVNKLENGHTLFFIPVQYYIVVLPVFGILIKVFAE
jgi:hypothetical protein